MARRIGRTVAPWWLSLLLVVLPAAAAALPTTKAPPGRPARPAVVQNYTPSPAVWLLEDADTRIYMIGTVHMLPPGFRWRSATVDAAVAAADELVVEHYDRPGDAPPAEAIRLILLDTPAPLLQRVPQQHRAGLEAAVAAGPIPLEAYAPLKTWMAAMMLGFSDMMGRWKIDDLEEAPGVEDVLEDAFRTAGKPISSIEDPVAVLRSVNAIPEEVQRELLVSGIAELAAAREAPDDELDHEWAQGKLDALGATLRDEMPPAFFEALVVRRNAAWTEWLATRLKRPGTILLAVGAGHLAGDVSVQTMLEKRGLAVRRLD